MKTNLQIMTIKTRAYNIGTSYFRVLMEVRAKSERQ